MVIECKIGSSFTECHMPSPNGRIVKVDQLAAYDKWLQAETQTTKALVLITHIVDPPSDFLSVKSQYKTTLRSVRRWAELYRWLSEYGDAFWGSNNQVLVADLRSFLVENELMTESPTLTDFAATRLFLCGGAHNRMTEAFSVVRQALIEKHDHIPSKIKQEWVSSTDEGWLYDYYDVGDGCIISWGFFFFKEDLDWIKQYEPSVSIFEGIFIYIERASPVKRPRAKSFGSWHFPLQVDNDDNFAAFNLSPFRTDSGDSSLRFANWVVDRFGGALQLAGRSVLRSVTGDLGFPRAEMSESIRDNPNRRLSHAGVAIGDFALDP